MGQPARKLWPGARAATMPTSRWSRGDRVLVEDYLKADHDRTNPELGTDPPYLFVHLQTSRPTRRLAESSKLRKVQTGGLPYLLFAIPLAAMSPITL